MHWQSFNVEYVAVAVAASVAAPVSVCACSSLRAAVVAFALAKLCEASTSIQCHLTPSSEYKQDTNCYSVRVEGGGDGSGSQWRMLDTLDMQANGYRHTYRDILSDKRVH